MKFEREATTKDGRRTWKVTYELVRGSEPKPKRKADQTSEGRASASSQSQAVDKKSEAKKRPPSTSLPKQSKPKARDGVTKKNRKNKAQLGLF